tara:strand:- start:130 stop:822 length:693 start_codon:yes stop_codon:yes gene_type:complete
MSHRFDVFKTFCFPSVQSQKDKDFIWLLGFDVATPPAWKAKIEGLLCQFQNAIPIYTDDINDFLPKVKTVIYGRLDVHDEYVITTRLDNDDILHESFTQTIKSLSYPKHQLVIDLQKGLQLQIGSRYEVRKLTRKFNPFVSLVERADMLETVFSRKHLDWQHTETVVIEDKKNLWIEFIHDRNMYNRKWKNDFLLRNPDLSSYHVEIDKPYQTSLKVLCKNLLASIFRLF